MSNVIQFGRPACANPTGELLVFEANGRWLVDHYSRSGDSAALVSTWGSRAEAMAAARMYAWETGCDFEQKERR